MRISTFRFAVLLLSAGIALACFARAQSTPTCTVNSDFVRPNCDPNKGWLIGETCVHKTVSCSSVNGVTIQDLGIRGQSYFSARAAAQLRARAAHRVIRALTILPVSRLSRRLGIQTGRTRAPLRRTSPMPRAA